MAQSVEHPTLDFGSGHDLMVHGTESPVGLCADSMEPAWDSLSLLLSPNPPLHVHTHMPSLSLSKEIKYTFLKKAWGAWVSRLSVRLHCRS